MRFRTRAAVAVAVGATPLTMLVAPAADAVTGVPTITVTMHAKSIAVGGGTTIQAGRVIFKVVAPSGDHTLQLFKLKSGYTLADARRDIDRAFGGNLNAIHRVDTKIIWFGGAEAVPNHPGRFAETLYAGTYYGVDQDGPGVVKLHVVGVPGSDGWIANNSTITTTTSNRFAVSSTTMPRTGWTLFRNRSAEPHMLIFQQVARNTTPQMVRQFINSGNFATDPPWIRSAETAAGVISPNTQILFKHNLPAGRYLLACFWPDDETGMPHFFMGMWRLVDLR